MESNRVPRQGLVTQEVAPPVVYEPLSKGNGGRGTEWGRSKG